MVNLLGLEEDRTAQQDFFVDSSEKGRQDALMEAFDSINCRYGRGAIHLGVRDGARDTDGWRMKREFLSPEYTTSMKDIPCVV